jgi:hypothetical protein
LQNYLNPKNKAIMKLTLLKLTVIVLLFAAIFSSCRDKHEYPVEISFTEFWLDETLGHWTNLAYDETVVVINSNEEFKKYITCTDEIPIDIDFSKNSMLIASGSLKNSVYATPLKLQQLAGKHYKLDLEIALDPEVDSEQWTIALVTTKKITKASTVELSINDFNLEYPIDVPFELYFERGGCGYYPECNESGVIIINSKEKLESYFHDIDRFACIEKGLPIIDFSNYSLLFIRGSCFLQSFVNNISLKKMSSNNFEWNIDILGWQEDGFHWTDAILIKKINSNCIIDVNVSQWSLYNWDWPEDYSILLFTKDYSLPIEYGNWANLDDNKVTIIENNEQLKHYVTCPENIENEYIRSQLLVFKISTPRAIKTISKQFMRFKDKYVLNLDIICSNKTQPEEKVIAFYVGYYQFFPSVELCINIKN